MDKYAVFIDAGYMKVVLRNLGFPKLDYLAFSEEIAEDDKRLRTYYYDCAPYQSPTPTADEKERKAAFDKWQQVLKRLERFEVRLGKLKRFTVDGEPKYEQKMVDILMAIELVRLSVGGLIQRAVIITNDTDFIPAINVAKDAGVIVTLYRGASDHNDALLEACDETKLMDKALVSKCLVKKIAKKK